MPDIGNAIELHATADGFDVVRGFVGHGMGDQFHTDPQVPHYHGPGPTITDRIGDDVHDRADDRHRQRPSPAVRRRLDRFTVDGNLTAQFEHTLLVTDEGAEVLTVLQTAKNISEPVREQV